MSEHQDKELIFSGNDLDLLDRFEFYIDGKEFGELYEKHGGSIGSARHIFGKFSEKYGHSIIELWSYLDTKQRKIVLKVIDEWLRKYVVPVNQKPSKVDRE